MAVTTVGDFSFSRTPQNELGKGQFGYVYKGKHVPSRKTIVVKVINIRAFKAKTDRAETYMRREVEIMKNCDHPNIVTFLGDTIHTNTNGASEQLIFMEYCNHGDLSGFLEQYGALDGPRALSFASQISEALHYLSHNNVDTSVIHRDLKPSNVLVHNSKEGSLLFKLGDFGFACKMDERKDLSQTELGSGLYCAPEVSADMREGDGYDSKVDMFSFGCLLFKALTLEDVFASDNVNELHEKKKLGCDHFNFNDILSTKETVRHLNKGDAYSFAQILRNLLRSDPKKRMNVDHLHQSIQAMKNPIQVYHLNNNTLYNIASPRFLTSSFEIARVPMKLALAAAKNVIGLTGSDDCIIMTFSKSEGPLVPAESFGRDAKPLILIGMENPPNPNPIRRFDEQVPQLDFSEIGTIDAFGSHGISQINLRKTVERDLEAAKEYLRFAEEAAQAWAIHARVRPQLQAVLQAYRTLLGEKANDLQQKCTRLLSHRDCVLEGAFADLKRLDEMMHDGFCVVDATIQQKEKDMRQWAEEMKSKTDDVQTEVENVIMKATALDGAARESLMSFDVLFIGTGVPNTSQQSLDNINQIVQDIRRRVAKQAEIASKLRSPLSNNDIADIAKQQQTPVIRQKVQNIRSILSKSATALQTVIREIVPVVVNARRVLHGDDGRRDNLCHVQSAVEKWLSHIRVWQKKHGQEMFTNLHKLLCMKLGASTNNSSLVSSPRSSAIAAEETQALQRQYAEETENIKQALTNEHNEKLKKLCVQHEAALAGCKIDAQTLKGLREDMSRLAAEKEGLAGEIVENKIIISRLQTELAAQSQDSAALAKLTTQLEGAQIKVEALQKELEQKEENFNTQSAEIVLLSKQVEELERLVAKQAEEIEEYKTKCASANNRVTVLTAEMADLSALLSHEKEATKYENENTATLTNALREEIKMKDNEIKSAMETVDALQTEIIEKEKSIAEANEKLAKAEENDSACKENQVGLQERIAALEDCGESMQAQLDATQMKLSASENTAKKLLKELQQERMQTRGLRNENNDLAVRLQVETEKLKAKLTKEFAKKKEMHEQAQIMLEKRCAKMIDCEAEMLETTSQLQAEKVCLENEVDLLKAKLAQNAGQDTMEKAQGLVDAAEKIQAADAEKIKQLTALSEEQKRSLNAAETEKVIAKVVNSQYHKSMVQIVNSVRSPFNQLTCCHDPTQERCAQFDIEDAVDEILQKLSVPSIGDKLNTISLRSCEMDDVIIAVPREEKKGPWCLLGQPDVLVHSDCKRELKLASKDKDFVLGRVLLKQELSDGIFVTFQEVKP